VEEKLPERAHELGAWFMDQLRAIASPVVKDIRGRGLMIGVEIDSSFGPARPFCEGLQARGILAKETHESVVRFAPPLVVEKADLEWAVGQIAEVLVPEMVRA
jgi:ornithine--oxo-acid transaminase